VGDDTTDEDGRFEIDLPKPGNYKATLDTSTLPKGIKLDEKDAIRNFTATPTKPAP